MHLTCCILLLELRQRFFGGIFAEIRNTKKEIRKKSNKCCHQFFQNQMTNCITGSLLSLQMLHSRSLYLSIIWMRAKLLEEDRCPMHILFSSHISFFAEDALIQQIQTQSYEGRDVPPFLFSALQGLARHSAKGHWTLYSAQSPSFRTLRYHHSTGAEQLLSSLQDKSFCPSRMQISSCQVATMALSSTWRSTIEMLINSNQYQILCLKWAAGSKMAAAELRFSSKHLEYKGKTTGPKISLTFKSRLQEWHWGALAQQVPNWTTWQREWVLISNAIHTVTFIKQDPIQVLQPVLLCCPCTAGAFSIGPRAASPMATHSKPMESRQ